MNTEHLTEAELQQAAENLAVLDAVQKQHISQCANCRASMENYLAIKEGLVNMESPAFDFDLAAQVMASLPVKKAPYSWIPAFAAGLGALLIAIMVAVFGGRINSLLGAMSASLLYLAIIPAVVLLVMQLIVAYGDHQRKMNNLINS